MLGHLLALHVTLAGKQGKAGRQDREVSERSFQKTAVAGHSVPEKSAT
jgi:hypothetical protein